MNQANSESGSEAIGLPKRMRFSLERFRHRVWTVKIAEGFLAGLFGLLLSYLAVFGLDRFYDTPPALRTALLVGGGVGLFVLFPLKCHNWVWRQRRLDQVARLVSRRFPRFGDHLLGIVELARAVDSGDRRESLVRAAIRQVDEELSKRDLADAVPTPRHRRWAVLAAIPGLLAVLVLATVPAAGGNALVRWLMPWLAVERYTFTRLESISGGPVVPYAEPFQVVASLRPDSEWQPADAQASIGRQQPVSTELLEGRYRFFLPPQTREGEVSVKVGDVRAAVPIRPVLRSSLQELSATILLPEYLQRAEPRQEDARGGTIGAVRGSQVTFQALANRPLAEAILDGRAQKIEEARVTAESIAVTADSEHLLAWKDEFGLAGKEAQVLRIRALEDLAPKIRLGRLENHRVVLVDETVSFEVIAGDDFGIRRTSLAWEGVRHEVLNPDPDRGERTIVSGDPGRETLNVAVTFSAEREGVRPQSLRVWAEAIDYFPEREPSRSQELVIHILSPEEHFLWVTEQLSRWNDAALEVYDRELELHRINETLSQLDPGELATPERQAELSRQAEAERRNAARLASLVDSGQELLSQAARNEEFDPEQLDSLAQMLQKLEEIAGERMPSVAELLAEAAAQAGNPAEPAAAGDSSTEAPEPGNRGSEGSRSDALEPAEKYGPEAEDIQGLDEIPEDPNESGAGAGVDRSERPGGEPGFSPANPTPGVGDTESGFNPEEPGSNSAQVKGGLGLPRTTLRGSGNSSEGQPATASQLALEAVAEQQELLDAFAELAEEMSRLLAGLENSTFVKRLKAASRKQIDLATELNELDSFGRDGERTPDAPQRRALGGRQEETADRVFLIQEDLEAYVDRRFDESYSRVAEEMKTTNVVVELRGVSKRIGGEGVGRAVIDSEFWSDTLDRWAEQLVAPLDPSGSSSQDMVELPNLPPEIILEVLRIIDREMQLREEAREWGQLDETGNDYRERGARLSEIQTELSETTRDLATRIWELPEADQWQNAINKLTAAATVMDEVRGRFDRLESGPATIAAITEVIEILLQAGRVPNAPMVVNAPPTTTPALLLMGLGDDSRQANVQVRAPGQATGKAGRELPAEYRRGLDAYLNALETRAER